jgi:general secretion pathway protein E
MVSRLKVMAELDIGERRLPQDGRFKLRAAGREIDFRLSVIPSVFGEDAVIRVLDRAAIEHEAGSLTLAALGFDGAMRAAIKAVASRPHGMLLVTGPTGSGKTTTLYAAITETNTGREKVITIEDPVEYQLPGVVQIPVNEKKGLTFARGLRSILRHDPDRVMVGEIRDAETAQIAVQAALTGHLVFSTVHANNAFDVLGRFMHMGLDLYNVVAALEAVMAQRLMRQVCGHCGHALEPTAAQRALLDGGAARPEAPVSCRVGIGCAHCRGTGYRGRRAVSELLLFDDDLRDLIAGRAPMSKIKQSARERGMQSLRSAALDAVRQGWTTFEELDRVTVDA